MKEVFKKEILKLLDVGIIYHISNSRWISLVHVVHKKGGMTVVKMRIMIWFLLGQLLGGECALTIGS